MGAVFTFAFPDALFLDPVYDPKHDISIHRHDNILSNGPSSRPGSCYPPDLAEGSCTETPTYYQQLQLTGAHRHLNHFPDCYSEPTSTNVLRTAAAAGTARRGSTSPTSTRNNGGVGSGGGGRYFCEYADCFKNGRRSSFSRRADLTRHYISVHGNVFHNCPWRKCERKGDRGFPRLDHLIEHRRAYHNEAIPKRESTREGSR